jgi:hypothetical protein
MSLDITKTPLQRDRIQLKLETSYGVITQEQHKLKMPPAVYFMTRMGDATDPHERLVTMYDGSLLVGWAQPTNTADKYQDLRYENLALDWFKRKLDYYGEQELRLFNLYMIRLNAKQPKVKFIC